MRKNVSEDLCHERSSNIEDKVDKIIDKVDHMKGNCLLTIKTKLNTLENHHGYNNEKMDNINKNIDELKEIINGIVKPKETPKVDKETVILALKVIVILSIVIFLITSGNMEKGVEIAVEVVKTGLGG